MKILKSVEHLHRFGFAIHLLHPKSKRPVAAKWSKGERASWKELTASYQKGMNVGVRLGSPSKIGKGYLAVIDCDVKSEDPRHVAEMEAKLKEFHEGSAPVVFSGRGNGSRHVYILTPEPVRFQRLSQSSEKVKVRMPSAGDPSKDELAKLTTEEIEDRIRLRAAWEIALMGEGQQVVLPPSIHPDTGKEYRWGGAFPDPRALPFRDFKQEGRGKDDRAAISSDWKPVPVDLVSSSLPDRVVDQILSGEGVGDRSAALLGVTNQMLRAGLKDDEILTVLTDPENYLGQVAYDHAQTNSRARAAEWIRKYTLEKSKRETLAEEQFKAEVEVMAILPDEEAEAQAGEIAPTEPEDWRDLIERGKPETGSKPKNTLKNVILILQGEGGKDVFKRDDFANAELYGSDAPWGGKRGAEFTDLDTILIKSWLADNYRFEPSNDRINEAVAKIASLNRYHPVREYLDRLEWDGKPRLDTWLKDYLGARAPEPYLSAVSRKVLTAMIARIYEPGTKFDYVLILEGLQGAGKSTALRNLVSDAWFTDSEINVSDKDAVMTMRSKWLIELGELSGMRSADVELLKAFVSRTEDRIRVPYGKRAENFPRQCVFIGTTNRGEYLKDPTGNRRYWPVKISAIDFNRIKRDRDQLFAEARFAYELGEPLYLDEPEALAGALDAQKARQVEDSWDEILANWLASEDVEEGGPRLPRDRFTMLDLFSDFGPFGAWKPNQPEVKRAGDALRKLGFEKRQVWDNQIKAPRKFWERSDTKEKPFEKKALSPLSSSDA